jgi:hypothetical protein
MTKFISGSSGRVGAGFRKKTRLCDFVKSFLHFPTDSSKELEELRSTFARALEYLQQEVEERKSGPDLLL